MSTTGSDAGKVTITVLVASLPVVAGGIKVLPNGAKIILSINTNPYPSQASNVYLGILAVTAGKTSSASVTVGFNRGSPNSFQFVGNDGIVYAATFEPNAITASSSSKRDVTTSTNVISQYYNDTSINNYLANCGLECNALIGLLGVIVDVYQAFGWHINFVFFSFPVNQLSYVCWDPCVGVCPGSSSMGALTAPLFWLTVCMVLAHLLWSWKHV